MPDKRTKREKLLDMATQSASPLEAEIARAKLADLPPPKTLSREDIMATPDAHTRGEASRVWDPILGAYVVMDDVDRAFVNKIFRTFDVRRPLTRDDPDLDYDGTN